MKIAISGASGFVGTYLTDLFTRKDIQVVALNRLLFQEQAQANLTEAISGCEVVINLAGASINHRWTTNYKETMYDSRISTTRALVEAINSLKNKPKLFISASAVGYYPSEGCYDEYSSVKGSGFLSDLCEAWENEAQKVNPDVRMVNTRFGVILASSGGAFEKLAFSAKLGFATTLGSGEQPFPWIDIEDLERAIKFIIQNSDIKGIVNLVAPQVISNKKLAKSIARHYCSIAMIKVPRFLLHMALGESSEFLLKGQYVSPTKLLDAGFTFKSPTIEDFMKSLL